MIGRRTLWISVGLGLLLGATPLGAQPLSPSSTEQISSEFAASYRLLRNRDAVLQNVGWRLLHGNAALCENTRLSAGLTVDDAASYNDPAAARAIYGSSGDFIVQSVPEGSPAAIARLMPGQEITAIDGRLLADLAFDATKPWERAAIVAELLTPNSTTRNALALSVPDRADSLMLPLVEICSSRLEVAVGTKDAVADGSRVVLDCDFVGFTYPEDEFAAAVAHELAHNVLRHRTFLDAQGRSRSNIRQTEREADRLMPWLLANAGYPPEAAVRFMRRWGPAKDGGLRLLRKHDRWEKRATLIERELPLIAASIAQRSSANWNADFIPQLERD